MMVDVALLTERGIVFCFIPQGALQQLRERVKNLKPNQTMMATIEMKEKSYEVKAENILVSQGGSIHG